MIEAPQTSPPAARDQEASEVGSGSALAEWQRSPEAVDAEWDGFLAASPLGHFQQCSLWALAKNAEGWKPLRMVLRKQGRLAGGFQILWRRTRLGPIGYIYK